MPAWPKPKRIQGCFVAESEIEEVVEHLKKQGEPDYHEEILHLKGSSAGGGVDTGEEDDPLIWEAADITVTSGLGSTSMLQRRLKVGYARAGRIMDMLETKGIVGPPDGSKPREVLADIEELESIHTRSSAKTGKAGRSRMGQLGDTLRERRMSLGISLETAENDTKIRGRLLKALEDGEYARLPNPGYVRGYVSSYARYLELDPVPLLAMHRAGRAPAATTVPNVAGGTGGTPPRAARRALARGRDRVRHRRCARTCRMDRIPRLSWAEYPSTDPVDHRRQFEVLDTRARDPDGRAAVHGQGEGLGHRSLRGQGHCGRRSGVQSQL